MMKSVKCTSGMCYGTTFDGYVGGPSTKSVEQKHRAAKATAVDIMSTGSMHTTTTEAEFLGNGSNKSCLIHTMSSSLKNTGINVEQATSDADAMVVSSAPELADHGNTIVLVGTDLLVMLVARGPSNAKLFMFRPSTNHKIA